MSGIVTSVSDLREGCVEDPEMIPTAIKEQSCLIHTLIYPSVCPSLCLPILSPVQF